MLAKIAELVKQYQRDIFLVLCIGLISFVSFNLGKISSVQKTAIKIEQGADIYKAISVENPDITASMSQQQIVKTTEKPKPAVDLRVVASKKSKTKLYHFTWCPGAKQIKQENQLWFNSEQEAIQTGYKLASNCTK